MSSHISTAKSIIIVALLLSPIFCRHLCGNATATTDCAFEGMVGTLPIKLSYLCNKIKDTNRALKEGTPLPNPFKNRIILYGPPGNGKTTVARKIAQESGSELFEAAGADIVQRYFGDGARNIDNLFSDALEHVERECNTAIIFIDEIDAIAKTDGENREEHLAAIQKLWTELDKIKKDPRLTFICATNNFNKLNNAFLGRFGNNKVEISNPDDATRREVLSYYAKINTGNDFNKKLLDKLVDKTKDLSIRDLEDLVEGSYTAAELNNNGTLTETIFEDVLKDIKKQAKNDEEERGIVQKVGSALKSGAKTAANAIIYTSVTLTMGALFVAKTSVEAAQETGAVR